jgi:hypothetical protein
MCTADAANTCCWAALLRAPGTPHGALRATRSYRRPAEAYASKWIGRSSMKSKLKLRAVDLACR